LVGVLPDNTWDTLYAFSWESDFDGYSGGVSGRSNILPADLGGTGGIFNLKLDLNPEDIPQSVRDLMTRDGSRNASLTIAPSSSVPEPSTIFGTMMLGMGILWKKHQKNRKK
jgi:hypothetical protein